MENQNTKTLRMSKILDAMAWWETMDRAMADYDLLTVKIAVWALKNVMRKDTSRSDLKDAIEERWWGVTENGEFKLVRVRVIID